MKTIKKLLTIGLAVLLMLCMSVSLVACGKIEYNTTIVKDGISFNADWLNNNMTYGAYYPNPNYNPEDEQSEPALTDTTSPKSRTYIIKDKNALDEIFETFPDIDFTKEMVIVYCFTTIYNRERILESVKMDENDILNIEFKSKDNNGRGDASMPGTAILTIRLDRLGITEANITYNGQ